MNLMMSSRGLPKLLGRLLSTTKAGSLVPFLLSLALVMGAIALEGCGRSKTPEEKAVDEWVDRFVGKYQKNAIKEIELKSNIGLFVSDEFFLRNLTGKPLNKVETVLVLRGTSGDSKRLLVIWPTWNPGEVKTISLKKSENVSKVSTIDLMGFCDEGGFKETWVSK
jgi:hypothetical protein